jgi:hypothetical protein
MYMVCGGAGAGALGGGYPAGKWGAAAVNGLGKVGGGAGGVGT